MLASTDRREWSDSVSRDSAEFASIVVVHVEQFDGTSSDRSQAASIGTPSETFDFLEELPAGDQKKHLSNALSKYGQRESPCKTGVFKSIGNALE